MIWNKLGNHLPYQFRIRLVGQQGCPLWSQLRDKIDEQLIMGVFQDRLWYPIRILVMDQLKGQLANQLKNEYYETEE